MHIFSLSIKQSILVNHHEVIARALVFGEGELLLHPQRSEARAIIPSTPPTLLGVRQTSRNIVAMKINLRNPLVFFDLETTGINIAEDRIVEYAFIKLMPDGTQTQKTGRINPERPIPEATTQIHGISDADVKDAPTFKQIAKTLAQFLEGCDLSGFNVVRFDVPILAEEFLRAGINFDMQRRKIVDLQTIFHLMEPRTLSAAYKFYCDQTLEDAHTAYADTAACVHILAAQIERYQGIEHTDKAGKTYQPVQNDMETLAALSRSNRVDLSGRMVYDANGVAVFNFGKYKNVPILEVLRKEPQYYDWMMRSSFPLETKQRLTEIKLSQFNQK